MKIIIFIFFINIICRFLIDFYYFLFMFVGEIFIIVEWWVFIFFLVSYLMFVFNFVVNLVIYVVQDCEFR